MPHDNDYGSEDQPHSEQNTAGYENLKKAVAAREQRSNDSLLSEITGELVFDSPFIDEEVMRQVFLPYFDSSLGASEEDRNALFELWIAKVSGNINLAVDIIGVDGSVVTTVPPLYDTGLYEVIDGKDIGDSIQHHSLEVTHIPHIADAKLTTAISKLSQTTPDTEVSGWVAFFDYFEIEHNVGKEVEEEEDVKSKKSDKSTMMGLFGR